MPYRIILRDRAKKGISKLQISKGDNVYTYEFSKYYQNKKHRKQLTIPAKLVEREYKNWLEEVYGGRVKKNTLKNCWELYSSFCRENKSLSENTKITLYLEQLVSFFPKTQMVEQLSVLDFDKFADHLGRKYPNPNTYNRVITVITSFFNFLNRREIKAPLNVLMERKKKTLKRGMKFLSEEQISTLLERAHLPHQKTFLMLALYTGMRHSEILSLKWEDVFLKEKYIQLKAENTKTKTSRIIPIIDALNNYLNDYLTELSDDINKSETKTQRGRKSDYLVSFLGKRLVTFRKSWQSLTRGLDWAEDFHIHDLRHHFITLLFSSNINPYEIQKIAGHSDLKMTMRYAELSEGYQQKRAQEISKKIGDI